MIYSLREADFYGAGIPEFGVSVPFDPSVLIESVFAGPCLDQAGQLKLWKSCESAGLTDRFERTTLLGRPRYT